MTGEAGTRAAAADPAAVLASAIRVLDAAGGVKLDKMRAYHLHDAYSHFSSTEGEGQHQGRNGLWHPALNVAAVTLPDLKADIDLMLAYAKPVGRPRFKFSDNLIENATKAINSLYCEGCAREFAALIQRVTNHYNLHDYKILPAYNCALALILKKIDAKLQALEGSYTLFNRLSLRQDVPGAFAAVFEKRLNSWLLTKPENSAAHAASLKPYIQAVLSKWRPIRTVSFKTWLLTRSYWARSGATDQVTWPGLSHTKASWAYSLTDDELWAWWLEHKDDDVRWKVFVKPDEVASFRLIVNSDTVTYLKMAYVSYLCESSLKGSGMFAFEDSAGKLSLMTRIQDALARGEWGVAFDGSGWDECITEDLITITVSELIKDVQDREAGLDTLQRQLKTALVDLPNGKEIKPINGLASGLRWTTLINSVINMALQLKTATDAGVRWTVVSTLGDDVVALTATKFSLEDAAKAYSSAGFKLNVSKSHAGPGRVEFLKQYIIPGRVSGVPLRALRAIMFSSSSEMEDAETLWHQRNMLWAKFAARMGGAVAYMFPHIRRDFAGAARSLRPLLKYLNIWLSSSAALGGGGWLDNAEFEWRGVGYDRGGGESLSSKRKDLVARVVRTQTNKFGFEREWVRGMRQRAESLLTGDDEVGSILAVAKIVEAVGIGSSKLAQYLLQSEFQAGVVVPAGALHDSVVTVLDGCQSRVEVKAVEVALRAEMPDVSARLRYVLNRWAWSGASAVIRGRLPTGLSARTMFMAGDMGAELLAPLVVNTAMAAAPRGGSATDFARVTVPVLKLVGTRGWRATH